MKNPGILITICILLLLCGCSLHLPRRAAAASVPPAPTPPAAPAPPTEPLSVPQTAVQLPPPQPLDPAALRPAKEPETTPAASERTEPASPTIKKPPVVADQAPKPEPPVSSPAAVPERPRLQEIVPAGQQRHIREAIEARRREIQSALDASRAHAPQCSRRRPSQARALVPATSGRCFAARRCRAGGRSLRAGPDPLAGAAGCQVARPPVPSKGGERQLRRSFRNTKSMPCWCRSAPTCAT